MFFSHIITNRIASLLIGFSTLFILQGCEEIMDIDFAGDSTPYLVVEGMITTDTAAHRVKLSFTADYFDQSLAQMAKGAQVTISDGTTSIDLHEAEDGIYYTNDTVHGEPGRTYTLSVQLTNGQQYTASDYMYPCTGFDSISQSANYEKIETGYGYDVLFYGREPEPSGNYYLFSMYKDNILYTDTITENVFSDDEFINGIYLEGYPMLRIREIDFQEESAYVTLEMYAISKQYYEFMMAFMTETIWRGSPWDGPPANIPGNISNGGKGYFRASEVKRQSRIFYSTPRLESR